MRPKFAREITCCFTGHRSAKLPWGSNHEDERCLALKEKLYDVVEALYRAGIRHFICGMALGSDMYFCEAVLRLRAEHKDVSIEAAIPCDEQTKLWGRRERRRYNYLVHQCDYETVIQHEYTEDCMQKRNRYMVDNSSVLVAVYDGGYGGTRQTIEYAARQGLEIIELKP